MALLGPARSGLLILGLFVACCHAQGWGFGGYGQQQRSRRGSSGCLELYQLGLGGVHPIHLGALTGGRKLLRNGVESSQIWTWLGRRGGRGLWGGTLGSQLWLSPVQGWRVRPWSSLRTGAWVWHGGRPLWISLPLFGFGNTPDLSSSVRIDERVTAGLRTGMLVGRRGGSGSGRLWSQTGGSGQGGRWGTGGGWSQGRRWGQYQRGGGAGGSRGSEQSGFGGQGQQGGDASWGTSGRRGQSGGFTQITNTGQGSFMGQGGVSGQVGGSVSGGQRGFGIQGLGTADQGRELGSQGGVYGEQQGGNTGWWSRQGGSGSMGGGSTGAGQGGQISGRIFGQGSGRGGWIGSGGGQWDQGGGSSWDEGGSSGGQWQSGSFGGDGGTGGQFGSGGGGVQGSEDSGQRGGQLSGGGQWGQGRGWSWDQRGSYGNIGDEGESEGQVGSGGAGGQFGGTGARFGGTGGGSGYRTFWSSHIGGGSPIRWRVIRYSLPAGSGSGGSTRWIRWYSSPERSFRFSNLAGSSGSGLSNIFGALQSSLGGLSQMRM